ncbi:SAM-dependent methyltransferase [Geomicrobium halophilum]|uniref:SAM-dependent methyltransferase n=1 Tax=Geomicrobium halophilum TaxID=549000 RepID=A0A841PKG6_9BACL|nr:class I SAM-dependent methyltransferase [Geomicrobium halophilum]MBB6449229.1 SAM-dependent methyltransferase [Geomicrobium halophilum]
MIITTSRNPTSEMVERGLQLSERFSGVYQKRYRRTIHSFLEQSDSVYMVGKHGRDVLYSAYSDQPLFFHPSMAKVRVQRMLRGELDPLVSISRLRRGDSFLDLTLGLGADSIVAAHVTGENGSIVGIEKNAYIAEIVARGLTYWQEEVPGLKAAMQRISVVEGDHLQYLQKTADNSFDVVYADPMFKNPRLHSNHLAPLRPFVEEGVMTETVVKEAKRVARHAVVLKTERGSLLFSQLGFESQENHRSISYGVIYEKGGCNDEACDRHRGTDSRW